MNEDGGKSINIRKNVRIWWLFVVFDKQLSYRY